MNKVLIELPSDVWRSVEVALADYLKFGPGELDAEYIPDEHLEQARKAILMRLAGTHKPVKTTAA